MGSNAEMIIDGIVCMECGEFIDSEMTGFPRSCDDCVEYCEECEG